MSKETNNKIVPRLRFPEFIDHNEWVDCTLSQLASFRRGSFPQPYGLPKWYDDINGMPFIQVFDVGDNFRLKSKTKNKISKIGAEQSVFIPEGTIIITIQGSIGRVAITQYNAYIDRTLLLFEDFFRPIDKVFIAYVLFLLFEIEKQKAPGGIIKTITKEVLSDFKINLPTSITEQQKIASCFSSLDDLITAHTQKLEALKTHKKGLMQQLFPAEGETVPRLRFEEFKDSGEWEERRLDQVLIRGRLGGNYENSNANKGLPVIKMGNIERGNINIEKLQFLPAEMAYEEDDILKSGDILLNTRNTLDLVGKVAIWNDELPKALYNSNLLRMTFDSKVVECNYFMNYLFNTEIMLGAIRKIATGTTSVAAIYTKDLLTLRLYIPSFREQQCISDCLSSLDLLISKQDASIMQLKTQKKGLMQALFPNIDSIDNG